VFIEKYGGFVVIANMNGRLWFTIGQMGEVVLPAVVILAKEGLAHLSQLNPVDR